MNEPEQQMALAAVDNDLGIVEQLRGLLTDQFWIVLGMVFLGAVFGIACAGAARLWRYWLDPDLPAREYESHVLSLKRWAFAAGALWTSAILIFLIDASLVVRLLLAVALGPITGLFTPVCYDLLRWVAYTAAPAVGKWLLDRIKTLLGVGQSPP